MKRSAFLEARLHSSNNIDLSEMDFIEAGAEKTAPERPRLKCVRLADIQTKVIEWLWQDRIPKGTLTLLEGDGGRGKSTIVADICSRWSNGTKLEDDNTSRPPMNVLLLAAEDDPGAVLRPRFEAHGANLANVRLDDQAMILGESGLDALADAIREHAISIVVIDPIVAFLGQKIDMNKGNDVRSVLGPLVALGRDTGCTFIVVRHFNKNSAGSASQRGAGSVDFRNAARSVLQVIHSEGKSYLALEKTNYAGKAKTLPFIVEDRKIVWGLPCEMSADEIHSENNTSRECRSAIDEAIEFLNVELATGPKDKKYLVKEGGQLGHTGITLRRASERLGVKSSRVGLIWQWSLPAAGQRDQLDQRVHLPKLDQVDQVESSDSQSEMLI